MKRFFLILLLVLGLGLPSALLAQQSPGVGNPQLHKVKAKTDKTKSESWKAWHKQQVEKLKEMDQRLDQKTAAMNSATGDAKLTAMSDLLNEMVAQRKEMQQMFRSRHGKRMQGKMRSSADTGCPQCPDCPRMSGKMNPSETQKGTGASGESQSMKTSPGTTQQETVQ